MVDEYRSGRFAVIVHADVAGSTGMVQRDERLAHRRMQEAFHRFGEIIRRYAGRVLELRGDALLAEFEKPSAAVCASLAFQANNARVVDTLDDDLKAEIRIGIAMGEVVVADNTATGAGVVLAQRVEQLAGPGALCITSAVHESLPGRMPFDFADLGEQQVKGFTDPVRVYRVELQPQTSLPEPEIEAVARTFPAAGKRTIAAIVVLAIAIGIAYLLPWQSANERSIDQSAAPGLPDGPSIVVLPFANLSAEGDDYFAAGISNGITTHLSKFKELLVISNTTAVSYGGKKVSARDIGAELGVAYVLEGSVLRGPENLQVHVQLIEAASDRHVWAEEYAVPTGEVFSMQASMIAEIVGTLSSTLDNEALEAVLKRAPDSLEAYDLYLRARAVTKTYKKNQFAEALILLRRAIEISPGFLEAHYYLSDLHLNAWRFGRSEDAEESLRLARFHAERVMEIDQADYRGHFLRGMLHLFAEHEHELALLAFERALEDNPNDTDILYYMGFLKLLMGEGEESIAWNEKAKRVNPHYPAWFNYNAAMGHFWVRDYEQALLLAKTSIALAPRALPPRRILIVTLVEMDRLDDARQAAAELLAIEPGFRLSTFHNTPYQHPEDQQRYFGALRKAGIPD